MFEGKRIVNAVAGHRHHVPLLLEGDHHVLLLLRRNTAKDIVFLRRLSKLRAVLGQCRGVNSASGHIHTSGLSCSAHSERVVTGEHLQRHTLAPKILHNLGGISAHILTENHEQHRRVIGRYALHRVAVIVTHHCGGMRQNHSAQPQRCQLSGALTLNSALIQKRLGGAQQPRP